MIDQSIDDGLEGLDPTQRYFKEVSERKKSYKQRVPKKKPIPNPLWSIETIEEIGTKYKDKRGMFLLYWLYLTGQRISEATEVRREDIKLKDIDGKNYIVVNSRTLKNRNQRRRNLPLPIFGKEKVMAEYVMEKIEGLYGMQKIFSILSKDSLKILTRNNAWNILSKETIRVEAIDPKTNNPIQINMKIYPHYLRHCRATHMATEYGYDLYELMRYFGWSSSEMATVYAYMNADSLAKKIGKGVN